MGFKQFGNSMIVYFKFECVQKSVHFGMHRDTGSVGSFWFSNSSVAQSLRSTFVVFTIYCQLKAAVYHYVTVLCMIYVYPHLPIKCWLVNCFSFCLSLLLSCTPQYCITYLINTILQAFTKKMNLGLQDD